MKKNLYVIFLSIAFSVILWISISLSNDYVATLQLPLKFINLPEGYLTSSPSSQFINVKLRGKGWNILTAMIISKNDYYVNAGNEIKKNQKLNLRLYAAENSWLTGKLQILEIDPDTVSFSFEKISYAKLKIVPHLQLEFKTGYGLAADVIVEPDSITISGPMQKVNSLTDIPTEMLKIIDLSDRLSQTVSLKSISGVTFEEQSATVILNVQRIVEHEFEDINIKVLDIPVDRGIVLLPNKINVSLRGGIDVLGKMSSDGINASVHYRDLVLDTVGSVSPLIGFPEHTELVYVKPQQLKYIIKKFNNKK